MKALTLGALAVSTFLLAQPALAFQVVQAPQNTDGTTRFADPDEQLDRLSQDRQDAQDQRAARYSEWNQQRNFGAQPRDDRSYWGSPLIESPNR